MLLPGSRGTFLSRVVVVASFARCQGKSTERMFLWYGDFFCVCVVFRFVCLSEMQLLTGHHCQMWFLLKACINYNLADLSCFAAPLSWCGNRCFGAQSSIWPLVLCSRELQKTIGEIKKQSQKQTKTLFRCLSEIIRSFMMKGLNVSGLIAKYNFFLWDVLIPRV